MFGIRKAQGAFEYILLIAGVIAIALIIVALLNTLGKSQAETVKASVGSFNDCILKPACLDVEGKYLCKTPSANSQCLACNIAYQNGKLSDSQMSLVGQSLADCKNIKT